MKSFSFFVFIVLFCVGNIYSEIIKVPSEQPTIQDGINAASNSDTVLVDPGTWVQSINFNGKHIVVGSLFLTTGETSYISGTVIDGNQTGTVVTFANGEDSTTLLCGFTLQNGSAEMGGGIFCEDASPGLKNLIIRDNAGLTDGGGLAVFGSSVSVETVTIENNTAEVGAGVYCAESDLSLLNVVVSNNTASAAGGGFQVHYSDLHIDSCTIANNQAQDGRGGGIQCLNDEGSEDIFEIVVTNTDFTGNSSTKSGGGMAVVGNSTPYSTTINILIDNCDFRYNYSDHCTGLRIVGESVTCILINSSFVGNEAITYGGGLGFSGFSVGKVSNCLFFDNNAATEGGDWNSGGVSVWSAAQVDFMNCTFAYNEAAYGSGLTVGYAGIATATNCIFWGNTEEQIALDTYENVGGTLTVSYCDVEGGQDDVNIIDDMSTLTWGEGNIDIDPFFVDWENEDFHLTDYSFCIGSGTPTGAPVTDIEGNPRPNPPGSNPDMGAYENSIGHMGPNIQITIDTLNFGQVYLGASDSLELIVRNNGTEDLLISSVLAEPDVFSVTPSFASLNPLETELFKVTFTPAEVSDYLGLLTFANNDPDSGNYLVTLIGTGEEADSAIVMPVYNSLREASFGNYMFLQEHSSDAIFVPTRGGDWDDGGVWRELQEHTWTPIHSHVNGAWQSAYVGIASANSAIDFLKSFSGDSLLISSLIAEARFLRSFYYWWLLDLFRNVPLVTDPTPDPNNPPAQNTPLEVFNFIVAEINAALPDLEESFGEENYGRVTKGAANALLATVYLNAEVYTGTAMWTECVAACDAVINSGNYDLMSTFNDVFALENEGPGNVENIFVVVHRPEAGLGFLRQMATLHYNQLPSSPWNGFSVLAEFYNAFDTSDVRIDQLLVGPQVVLGGPNAGEPAFDRLGNPLIFTVESPLTGATEGNGVRMLKWPVDPNASGGDAGNDYAIFRYSHILLAKAEAQFMLGATGDALALVNYVRERAFEPDEPLASITLDDILAERGFELLWEGLRRQDLIRTGHFLEAWTLKYPSDGPHRKLFPIPQSQLDVNPNLIQNDGYDGPIGIPITDGQYLLPEVYALRQNYPNPFNPSTMIQFALPKPESVKIKVYNIIGQKIETLLNQHMKAGYHEVEFITQNLSSGIYFYRIEAGEFQDVKKMVLLR